MRKNECIILGQVQKIKKKKTKDNEDYAYILMEIEPRSSDEFVNKVNVMVFKQNIIKYLENIKAHRGSSAIVFGFITSHPIIIKGQEVMVNSVVADTLYVIQTRPYGNE